VHETYYIHLLEVADRQYRCNLIIMETLIDEEFPAVQGSAAIISSDNALTGHPAIL
jgi:phosphohistidine swiveling domain-containing protein